jgi:hypothetical protein
MNGITLVGMAVPPVNATPTWPAEALPETELLVIVNVPPVTCTPLLGPAEVPAEMMLLSSVSDDPAPWRRTPKLAATPANVDALITDHHQPNRNGLEFLGSLRRSRSFLGKIVVF